MFSKQRRPRVQWLSNSTLISSVMLFITVDICFDAAGTVIIQEYPEGDFNLKIYFFHMSVTVYAGRKGFFVVVFFFLFSPIANGFATESNLQPF